MAKIAAWAVLAVFLCRLGCAGAFMAESGMMAVCAAAASCLPIFAVTPVSTGHEVLVERFGRFHRRLTPGWHVVFWPIESVSMSGSLREQVLDIPSQPCYTR